VLADQETIEAFASHPFFADRFCSVYCPIDIAAIVHVLGSRRPYNASLFPGFSGFDEKRLLDDPQLSYDHYRDHPVPKVGRLPQVSVVEVGMFAVRAGS
jgi:hypothetical protein